MVGIAVEKIDYHLLPDARDMHAAVVAARPGLGDADPAAGVFVFLAIAVPVELHFDAAKAVGVDLFVGRAGHHGGLGAGGAGLGGAALTAVGGAFGHGRKADAVAGAMVCAPAVAAVHVFCKAVVGRLDQILLVLVAARVLAEAKQITRGDVAGVAIALHHLTLGLLLFDAHAGIVLAIGHMGIATGPVKVLPAVFAVACRLLLPGVQNGAGTFKVVIVRSKVARCDVFGKGPAVHEIFIVHLCGTVAGVVGVRAGALGERAVATNVIGQHQGMAAVAVFEEEIGTFHFQQARDKVEVALAVLHQVLPAAVLADELVVDHKAIGRQHFLDDLRDFLELKDLEIRAPGGVPQPGAQYRFIGIERAVFAGEAELGDLPGEKARVAAVDLGREIDLDAHVLAQQAFGRDALGFTDEPDPVLEQAGDLFAAL